MQGGVPLLAFLWKVSFHFSILCALKMFGQKGQLRVQLTFQGHTFYISTLSKTTLILKYLGGFEWRDGIVHSIFSFMYAFR
jgi:hypothetical protein